MVATQEVPVVIPAVHQEVVTLDLAPEVILEVVTQALLLPHNREAIQVVPRPLRAAMLDQLHLLEVTEAPLRDKVDTVPRRMVSHKWTPTLPHGLGLSTR